MSRPHPSIRPATWSPPAPPFALISSPSLAASSHSQIAGVLVGSSDFSEHGRCLSNVVGQPHAAFREAFRSVTSWHAYHEAHIPRGISWLARACIFGLILQNHSRIAHKK
ncbi:hypothetical protein IG631_07073 [Alternaria alternata]|nr:hypothetical protein IG631_07073 [Alternaria alternata]